VSKKTSDSLLEEYDDANESDDQVYDKLESLFPVIGCPWMFYNSFCGGIVLGPVDAVTGTNQDISTRARRGCELRLPCITLNPLQTLNICLKSYLAGLKACGMTPNRHKEKSKMENTFRKRVTKWEPLSLCYLSEVAWGVGKRTLAGYLN
jgi:hypothetical protein